ncbi:hypothetical protein OUZ56_020361 [Daphnia magna]|uniref:Uncharacterized protein n=1 Tax=Daphnia magna TaxID=35525 RepID=A0ABQ9ZEA4_9CRUS|nr:hypothetical protein OUZ56_020361 [Daphnia magna]
MPLACPSLNIDVPEVVFDGHPTFGEDESANLPNEMLPNLVKYCIVSLAHRMFRSAASDYLNRWRTYQSSYVSNLFFENSIMLAFTQI